MKINFTLNNKATSVDTDPLRRLLDVLREDLDNTGVKEGCGQGECGACSILMDGRLTNSCLIPIGSIEGKNIVTIDGYRDTEKYDILKTAFEDAGTVQCGFCMPGMIMAAESILSINAHPTEEQIREGISGNLCRCTGYSLIVDAIKLASERGEGLW